MLVDGSSNSSLSGTRARVGDRDRDRGAFPVADDAAVPDDDAAVPDDDAATAVFAALSPTDVFSCFALVFIPKLAWKVCCQNMCRARAIDDHAATAVCHSEHEQLLEGCLRSITTRKLNYFAQTR